MRNLPFAHAVSAHIAAGRLAPVLALALCAGRAGAAGLHLETEVLSVQSTQSYGILGARTRHVFTFPEAPRDAVAVELVAQGDYGLVNETATLSLDGVRAGAVGGTGTDCLAATGNYTIAPADMIQFVTDGTLYADVQNTMWVNLFCDGNTHRVTMQYRLPLRALTLTAAYPGGCAQRVIHVHNGGSTLRAVKQIVTTNPAFQIATGGFELAPGAAQDVPVQFCPAGLGQETGSLIFQIDDDDAPQQTIAVTGRVTPIPWIEVEPDSVAVTLPPGAASSGVLAVENRGVAPLTWTAAVTFAPAGSAAVERADVPLPAQAANADFTRLANPPWPVNWFVEDWNNGVLYAGRDHWPQFARYDPATNTWTSLAARPAASYFALSGVVLAGKVYVPAETVVEVYDIQANQWTTMPAALGLLGMITTDAHLLYVENLYEFLSFDPATGARQTLPPHGASHGDAGLQYFAGRIYTHVGTSYMNFDVAARSWEPLPSPPAYLNNANALDPVTRKYYAMAGSNWCRFDLAAGTWTMTGNPIVYAVNPAMAALPYGRWRGIYFAEGTVFGRYAPPPVWLHLDASSGSVPPGGAQAVHWTLDSSQLLAGLYNAQATMASNDPLRRPVARWSLNVTAEPRAQVSVAAVDFGPVVVGTTATRRVSVYNAGDGILHVTGTIVSGDEMSVDPGTFAIASGLGHEFAVRWSPTTLGPQAGQLAFTTDDKLRPVVPVSFAGVAVTQAGWEARRAAREPEPPFESAPPAVHALRQNVPNPFNPATRIEFDLPAACELRLDVFDVAGRTVRTLVASRMGAGRHTVQWDGRDTHGRAVPSAIYYYRLRAGAFESTRPMTLVR